MGPTHANSAGKVVSIGMIKSTKWSEKCNINLPRKLYVRTANSAQTQVRIPKMWPQIVTFKASQNGSRKLTSGPKIQIKRNVLTHKSLISFFSVKRQKGGCTRFWNSNTESHCLFLWEHRKSLPVFLWEQMTLILSPSFLLAGNVGGYTHNTCKQL